VFDAIVRKLDPGSGSGSSFTADSRAYLVIAQGGWWYRGEYRVMAEPADRDATASGTRLEYEIVNVAQNWHWAGPIAGRKVLADAPYGFHALLSDIEAELNPGVDPEAGPESPQRQAD
jgi:hypothetical protein